MPSDTPSVLHSDVPSVQPSRSPSMMPSTMPSTAPSVLQSDVPSFAPSIAPSTGPSSVPSDAPSVEHSGVPSMEPSQAPSSVPSTWPSSVPSVLPSSCVATGSIDLSAAADTWLYAGTPDTTYEALDDLSVDRFVINPFEGQALLKFDLSSIPSGAAIDSAVLRLFTNSGSSGNIRAYQMIHAWDNTSTWNLLGGGISPNGIVASSTASFTLVSPPHRQFIYQDVTVDLHYWVLNPSLNQGWGFINDSTSKSICYFHLKFASV